MPFNRVRGIAVTVSAVLMAFLFVVPPLYLTRVTDRLDAAVTRAEQGLAVGDDAGVQGAMNELCAIMEENSVTLEMFLNHNSVDALVLAVEAARPLNDPENLRAALAGIRAGMDVLKSIEIFSLSGVL